MQIGCFSVSMYDELQDKLRALQKYVKSLPITDFDGADRAQMSALIASKYHFPKCLRLPPATYSAMNLNFSKAAPKPVSPSTRRLPSRDV